MPATRLTIMTLALAMPVLGGCQSLFGSKLTVRPSEGTVKPGDEAAYATAQLEAGRKALDEGQLSAAITAFRNARLYPDQAAAAANGLAIAYSQLGRPDLAERYFRQAVAMAPADKRYQANLQRFYRLNPIELAMSSSDLPAAPPAAARAPVRALEAPVRLTSQSGTPSTVVASRPQSRLVRLSANEVRLGSGAPATAVSAAKARTAAGYPARVSWGPREVFVGKAPPPQSAAAVPPRASVAVAAKAQYPVRVKLQSR